MESAFHSQQAAEKSLKTLFLALGEDPTDTHVIKYLLDVLDRKGYYVDLIMDSARLSDYAEKYLYPDNPTAEPDLYDAQESLAIAVETIKWVRRELTDTGIECD